MNVNNAYKQQSKFSTNTDNLKFYIASIEMSISYIDKNLNSEALDLLVGLLDTFSYSTNPMVQNIINILSIICLKLESKEEFDKHQVIETLKNLLIT